MRSAAGDKEKLWAQMQDSLKKTVADHKAKHDKGGD